MSTSNDSWPTRDGLRRVHLNINHAINKLTDIASVSFNSGKKYNTIYVVCPNQGSPLISPVLVFPCQDIALYSWTQNQHKEIGLVIYIYDSWSSHATVLCKSTSRKTYQLFQIKCLKFKPQTLFFDVHIQLLIDYGSTLWDSASANTQNFG